MSGEAVIVVRAFAVGARTCTITIPRPRRGAVLSMCVEWEPDPPRRLSPADLAAYRAGRDAAIAELGRLLGERVAVFEL